MLTNRGIRAIFLFIAELRGGFNSLPGNKTVKDKVKYGFDAYLNNLYHDLDELVEADRSDMHENIFLERIYDKLDSINKIPEHSLNMLKKRGDIITILNHIDKSAKWDIPLELDASASMLGIEGALLGEDRLLREVNMHGRYINDPWDRGMDRFKFKKAATPLLYGSSQTCTDLWKSNKITYELKDAQAFNKELATGSLGIANMFKNFIITSCAPKESMRVNINNEIFTVQCNRFRNVGEQTRFYEIYDSDTDSIRRLHHTVTKRVPDLEQFRTYFVTLLIHNLDSQVANTVAKKVIDRYGFCLDIHDAFLVHPNAAEYARKIFAEEIDKIYANRNNILNEYFKSIGISGLDVHKFEALMAKVVPVKGFKCNRMALK